MLARAVVSAKFAPLHQSVDMSDSETFQLDQRLADLLPGKKRGRGAAVRRDRFMLALNDRLQSLSDPVAIQREACRVLGEHLGCDWAHFLELQEGLLLRITEIVAAAGAELAFPTQTIHVANAVSEAGAGTAAAAAAWSRNSRRAPGED